MTESTSLAASGIAAPPWPDGRAGADDFYRVLDANLPAIRDRVLGWLKKHDELSRVVGAVPETQVSDYARAASQLQRNVADGWTSYRASLERRGAAYAEAGVSFRACCEEARIFARFLLPYLIEAYAAEPERLVRAIEVMTDFQEYGVSVVGDTYVARIRGLAREREVDLAATLDSIGDAVIVTDSRGCVVRMNPVAERLTGFALSQCRGKPLEEIFRIEHEDTGEPVESPVPRVLREGAVAGLANHTVLVNRDGTRCPIADSGAPVRSETGEVRGVVLVFRDVSEERRTEETLRHWERIFQHATWGVALASVDDVCFRSVNPAYAEMHGYTVDELVGKPVSTLWAPETKADMERHAAETHDHGRLVAETTHLRKDGSPIPVEIVATTIKDASGKVRWFVANVQDITERRRLQQSRVRAIELEAQNRRIEEANRLKSEFLASMSHELRTPLNSIIGFAELLHDEQVGSVAPQQREFLGDILASGRHLLRLINDVLDLAKVEAGKMEFRPEPVDVPELVGAVVTSARAIALDKQLQVDWTVDPTLNNIVLDPARFKQVIYNYVSNALKFTPDGGRVAVRVLPEGEDRFRLEVEDTGIGISEESLNRLFVAFQQLDSGAAKRHAGTGLGLALTKRLAEAQGGTVGVRPAPVQGSIFFAVLPRRPGGYTDAFERASDRPLAAKLLVVEHDATDRAQLVRILTDAGYDVDAVASCAEAAESWKRRTYGAITLDLALAEGEDLHSLLRLIRHDDRTPDVPIIAMTIMAGRETPVGFAVSDVLTKPIDAAALLAALERRGLSPAKGKPIVVIDDDAASLRLMEATLATLGYESLCFSDARRALRVLKEVRPLAVVVDLIMPGMDGLSFLEKFRATPENQLIPVMIWTVKDLSVEERRRLQSSAEAVVQKGVEDTSRLFVALQSFLGAGGAGEHVEHS